MRRRSSLSRTTRVVCALLAAATLANTAIAAPTNRGTETSIPAPHGPQVHAAGVAVVGMGTSRQEAFALARAVYASGLRPPSVDEAHARVLAGEPVVEPSPADLRELVELRRAIVGDDVASRRLLGSIAAQFHLAGILVVDAEDSAEAADPTADAGADAGGPASLVSPGDAREDKRSHVEARLFLADAGAFDAARYEPDPTQAGPASWAAVVASVGRVLPASGRQVPETEGRPEPGNALATHPVTFPRAKDSGSESKPFYASPWFWGAIGGAALLGAGIFFASRGSDQDAIQLRMQIPK